MYVKIIKSSKDSYWYADKIGLSYEVTGVQDDAYEVKMWTGVLPLACDIAPVLKADCEEQYNKKNPEETKRNPHWQMNPIVKASKSKERSGFKMTQEINHYEKLNKEAEVKEIKE